MIGPNYGASGDRTRLNQVASFEQLSNYSGYNGPPSRDLNAIS